MTDPKQTSSSAPPSERVEIPPDPLERAGTKGHAPPPTVELAIRDALKKGDVNFALTLATSHYRSPLIRFCLAFVHDEPTAEDVAQTARQKRMSGER